MKVYVKSLNICPMRRVNIFQYREALKMNGYEIVGSPEEADKILVWTCAVRQDFHDNSISVLKQFENDGYNVVAAGCLPLIAPELLSEQFRGEVLPYKTDGDAFNRIFGGALDEAPYPVAEAPILIPLDDYRANNPGVKVAFDDQYIKLFISEGCTKECSYCTEVKAFPPYQSYPINKIATKARDLIERTGVKKVALFGDDIGSYGIDSGNNLVELIYALTAIDPEVVISLKQIHPLSWKQHFNELKKLIDTGKIFQMLVPIQSANTRVLQLMGRGYSTEDLRFLFDSLADHGQLELETHIIAGFPTETEAEWQETVDFVCRYRFRYVMGNIYMSGPGTVAAEMPGQIDITEKEQRMLSGADVMEKHGAVVGHNLSWRQKEHLTHSRIDFTEL